MSSRARRTRCADKAALRAACASTCGRSSKIGHGAAAAQFVGAVFHALGQGATAQDAVARVRRAFASGHHGAEYAHPFYWAGWVVWGGL